MNRFGYSKFTLIPLVLLTSFVLPSCVAKKKFIEMETSRNRADRRVRELTADVKQLEADFNRYKNEFHFNNSIKDNKIDSLRKEITNLNLDLNSKSDNIEGQIFSFQVEKRRLNQMLADKDREIREMKNTISALNIEISDLKNLEQELNIKVQNLETKSRSQVADLELKESDTEKLRKEIELKKSELNKLKSTLAEKDEQLEILRNQVKLLKSQFGQQ